MPCFQTTKVEIVPGFEQHIRRMLQGRRYAGEDMVRCSEIVDKIRFEESFRRRPHTAAYGYRSMPDRITNAFSTEHGRNFGVAPTGDSHLEERYIPNVKYHLRAPDVPMATLTTYDEQYTEHQCAARQLPCRYGRSENNPHPDHAFMKWRVPRQFRAKSAGSALRTSNLYEPHLLGPTITETAWKTLQRTPNSEYMDKFKQPNMADAARLDPLIASFTDSVKYSTDSTMRTDFGPKPPDSPTPLNRDVRPAVANGIVPESTNAVYARVKENTEYTDNYCGGQMGEGEQRRAEWRPRPSYVDPEEAYTRELARDVPPPRPPSPTLRTHPRAASAARTPPRALSAACQCPEPPTSSTHKPSRLFKGRDRRLAHYLGPCQCSTVVDCGGHCHDDAYAYPACSLCVNGDRCTGETQCFRKVDPLSPITKCENENHCLRVNLKEIVSKDECICGYH